MGKRRFDHVEVAENVGAESIGELIFRNIFDGFLNVLFGGVIDQTIQLSKFSNDFFDRLFAMLFAADISGN